MDVDREGRSRRHFLGIVGKTAAAAVGISLLPQASAAAAGGIAANEGRNGIKGTRNSRDTINATVTYSCCINTSHCSTYQCGSKVNYYCTSNNGCAPAYCTGCTTYRGSCYSFQSGC